MRATKDLRKVDFALASSMVTSPTNTEFNIDHQINSLNKSERAPDDSILTTDKSKSHQSMHPTQYGESNTSMHSDNLLGLSNSPLRGTAISRGTER